MDKAARVRARVGLESARQRRELARNAKKILFRRNEPNKSFGINKSVQKTNLKVARIETKKAIKEQALDQKT
jgi:hypothetical protein